MQRSRLSFICVLTICLVSPAVVASASNPASSKTPKEPPLKLGSGPTIIELHRGWTLQSSCKVKAGGDEISKPGFASSGWHHAEVPNTVVGALIADKTFSDPYYGMNLRSYPGMDYSSKEFFANEDMPENSPYRCSWWFRTDFTVPAGLHKTVWLDFKGINYRANVWLNGHKIADSNDVAGMNSAWEFAISKSATKNNALAVEVLAPDN